MLERRRDLPPLIPPARRTAAARRALTFCLAAAGLAAFDGAPALAEDTTTSESDYVVTATRVPTDPARIASSVTVVTAEEIQRRQYQTVVDVLNHVPGVHIAQSGPRGTNASVFTRGTEFEPHAVPDQRHPRPGPEQHRRHLPIREHRRERHRAGRGRARRPERALRLGRDRRRHQHHHQEGRQEDHGQRLGRGRLVQFGPGARRPRRQLQVRRLQPERQPFQLRGPQHPARPARRLRAGPLQDLWRVGAHRPASGGLVRSRPVRQAAICADQHRSLLRRSERGAEAAPEFRPGRRDRQAVRRRLELEALLQLQRHRPHQHQRARCRRPVHQFGRRDPWRRVGDRVAKRHRARPTPTR